MNKPNDAFASFDDIAARLPRIEFKTKKRPSEVYEQKMQSLRGARQFILRTYENEYSGTVLLTLIEYGKWERGESIVVATRTAQGNNPDSFKKALKSLERKARCKLYYVLLISTDGEYL